MSVNFVKCFFLCEVLRTTSVTLHSFVPKQNVTYPSIKLCVNPKAVVSTQSSSSLAVSGSSVDCVV
jgi:hypothetical protein